MNDHILKLRSSVSPSLLRAKLLRGTLLALLGISFLGYFGLFLPINALEKWGGLIFFLGLGLIIIGLVPYRKLTRLEMQPNEIIVIYNDRLIFNLKGEKMMTIPWKNIEKTAYLQTAKSYGIGIWLKRPMPEKNAIHDEHFDLISFQKKAQLQGCDLFLPFFSQRSYHSLEEFSQA